MRRWACVLVLLFGFGGDAYAWTVRPRAPIPVERPLSSFPSRGGLAPAEAWWRTS